MRALVKAVGGDDRLALDFGGKWAAPDILALCSTIKRGLAWLEEPYAPGELHRARPGEFPFPHAAGEHSYNLDETAILVAAGVDIWQPDAVFCGGFGALCDFARKAVGVGARCLPHGGGLVPAVHAAIVGAPIECVEYHLRLEPIRQAHFEQGLLLDDKDHIEKPLRPGWAGELRVL